jgi:hypothetical protein
LVIGFIDRSQVVTTTKYNSLAGHSTLNPLCASTSLRCPFPGNGFITVPLNYSTFKSSDHTKSSWHSLIPFLLSPSTTHSLNSDLRHSSQSNVTTDGHSASLSWNKAPIWALRPDLYYCHAVAGLLVWGALLTRGRVCHFPDSQQ